MCINAEISISSWLIASYISILIIKRGNINDKWMGSFILVVAFMQFLDFLMWIGQDNDRLNIFATKMAFLLLWLQPLALVLFSCFSKTNLPVLIRNILIIFYSIIFIYAIYYILNIKNDNEWISRPGPNCHLVWNFFNIKIPKHLNFDLKYSLQFLIILFMKPFSKGLFCSVFSIVIFLISLSYSYKEYGSIWCWMVNIFAIIWYYLNA